MERQRSFSSKTTRFLAFAFTISSSVIFLIFFSTWLVKITPSVRQETHFNFNKPSSVQTLTTLSTNFSAIEVSNSIPIDTHFRKPKSGSWFVTVSRFDGAEARESGTEVSSNGKIENDSVNGNLIGTHFRKSENVSGFVEDSLVEGIDGKENESIGSNGKVATTPQIVFDNLPERKEVLKGERVEEENNRICDITRGRWVFDERYPLYTYVTCPFIDEGFNCEGNGRLDKEYMKWRWQPQDCDIPRFNATKMLELIRGKRLVFVGDSINRNQWESMLCLLMGAIKDPKRVYETHGRRITKEKGDYSFKFVDYKCTIEYHVTHFLVHESKARVGKKRMKTLRIDAMDRGSSKWREADILIFNTAHWWTHFKTQAGINYYQEGDQVHPRLDVSTAFRRALTTWASWVDKHINPGKTQVFFRSSAPSHFRGGQWNSGGHCNRATQPLHETSTIDYPEKNYIVEEVIRQMKTPVTLLNVTGLSGYRIDGHPSIYGRKSGKSYSSSVQDCSHWCLPGVPDTWNELLFFHLQSQRQQREISAE